MIAHAGQVIVWREQDALVAGTILHGNINSAAMAKIRSFLDLYLDILGMVGVTRFELVTSAMSTQRSNQLSYTPVSPHHLRRELATYNAPG